EPDDVREIVDEVGGNSPGPEGTDRLDAMVPIQDYEVAIGHEDRSSEVSILPDLVRQLLEQRRSDPLVATESADLHDLESDGRRSPGQAGRALQRARH